MTKEKERCTTCFGFLGREKEKNKNEHNHHHSPVHVVHREEKRREEERREGRIRHFVFNPNNLGKKAKRKRKKINLEFFKENRFNYELFFFLLIIEL